MPRYANTQLPCGVLDTVQTHVLMLFSWFSQITKQISLFPKISTHSWRCSSLHKREMRARVMQPPQAGIKLRHVVGGWWNIQGGCFHILNTFSPNWTRLCSRLNFLCKIQIFVHFHLHHVVSAFSTVATALMLFYRWNMQLDLSWNETLRHTLMSLDPSLQHLTSRYCNRNVTLTLLKLGTD